MYCWDESSSRAVSVSAILFWTPVSVLLLAVCFTQRSQFRECDLNERPTWGASAPWQ